MREETKKFLQNELKIKYDYLDKFHEFTQVDINGENGSLPKGFLLVDGELLLDMYDEIKNNPNGNVVTCVNDYINSTTREEFKNAKVSVVCKAARHGYSEFVRSEVMASKICAFLGVNSAYVEPLNDDYTSMMSVDFLSLYKKKNNEGKTEVVQEKFETFEELADAGAGIGRKYSIKAWLNKLIKAFENNPNCKNLNLQQKNKIIEDFIRMFIVRKLILRDNDFNVGNTVFTFTGDYENIKLGTCFDFEFCFDRELPFMNSYDDFNYDTYIEENIKYLAETFPNVTKKVLDGLVKSYDTNKSQIKDVLYKHSETSSRAMYWEYLIQKSMSGMPNLFQKGLESAENENNGM